MDAGPRGISHGMSGEKWTKDGPLGSGGLRRAPARLWVIMAQRPTAKTQKECEQW